ncbi:AAA family ATPase [Citreicella sp. C3M06]|uniref:YhaN family protein n=1 Tax=Citreicella sp. C3M06 TaxID=2841564 RepID=UPI001C093F85|nr:YhaN family protein [Citreicella sp. C3M06]MBU2963077.1 AAA family ATPase [Citreicella sp. C3M06]
MRLNRLDLIRYGRFENHTLDFGEAADGPDVTLVFGQNEAGKSTAFSAWLDLLYGLPLQHSYDFRFSRSDLMVGAVLDGPEGPLTLRRTGKRKGSLTDDDGREVDEGRLAALLHGLGRDAFRTRFSLDDATLRRGGKEIAEAQGDLGQLLHAGSSGLSGVSDILSQTEKEIDDFHKKGRSKSTLALGKAELKRIDAAMADAQLDPREHDRMRLALDEAQTRLSAATTAQDEATRALALREAADARRALARRIAEIDTALQAYADGPDLRPDAVSGVRVAAAAIRSARTAQAEATQEGTRAAEELETLQADPQGLEVAALIAQLEAAEFEDGKPLLGRVYGAEADAEKLGARLEEIRAEARALAEQIAGPGADPAQIALPRATLASLRETADAAREAARDRDRALKALAEAEATLGETQEMPDGWQQLGDALDALAPDPADLANSAQQAGEAARRAASGLPQGWAALAQAGLPELAELRAVESAAQASERALADATLRLEDTREQLAEAKASYDAQTGAGAVVSDAAIAQTRALRDTLWADHRAALSPETADSFEAAMHEDDAARQRHGETREARVRLEGIVATIDRLTAQLARREADARSAAEAARSVAQQADAMAARLGLAAGTTPGAFASRCDAIRAASLAALEAEAASKAHDAASAARAAGLEQVTSACIALAGQPLSLAEAERLRADLEARAARIAQQEKARTLVADQARAAEQLQAAEATAQGTYDAAVAGLWCAGLSPQELLAQLDRAAELRELLDDEKDKARRVGLMRRALQAFEARAGDLRALLNLPQASPAALIRAGIVRRDAAEHTARAIAAAEAAQRTAQVTAEKQAQIITHSQAEIARLLAGQSLPEGGDAEAQVAALSSRDALRTERREAANAYAAQAAGHDQDRLALEEADPDPARSVHLADALEAAKSDRDAALVAQTEARQTLSDALRRTGAAGLAQERASLLETLREEARHAVLARVGLMAARGALSRLREDRRGPMLTATQAAFATMTGGDWPRLETRPGVNGEQLVGVREDRKVAAEAMSTGTRAQLYLALRIAGHADFTRRFGPLPFVTDDILETFDDGRAGAALELTASMGQLGQAIMFTHHAHLVTLAQERIPGLRVISLD